jgi:hypothetical protein
MPAGTVAGDCFILAAANSDPAAVTDVDGATALIDAVMGTGRALVVKKIVTAADIASGYTFTRTGGTGSWRYALAVYRGAGFGTMGAPTYRSASGTTITADGDSITATSGQTVVVVRCEKSTNNPGPATVLPATSLRQQSYGNGTSAPSIWVGDYAAPAADRTFTDPIASANGMGVQIPVMDSALGYTISVWDGTTELPATLKVWDGTVEQPATVST